MNSAVDGERTLVPAPRRGQRLSELAKMLLKPWRLAQTLCRAHKMHIECQPSIAVVSPLKERRVQLLQVLEIQGGK